MATSRIAKPEWHMYFDRIANTLAGKSAEIDIESLAIGCQVDVDWAPLLGITYDEHDDILAVMLEGLNHLVRHPRSVFVDLELGQLSSMDVIDGDDMHHIIKLRDPLPLDAPH